MYLGNAKRDEKEWDRTRHLMASVMNTVASKPISAKKVIPLPLIDAEDKVPIVRTDAEAYNILNEFKNGITEIRS